MQEDNVPLNATIGSLFGNPVIEARALRYSTFPATELRYRVYGTVENYYVDVDFK